MPSDAQYNTDAILTIINGDPEWAVPVDAESLCPSEGWCDDPLLHELVFSMLLWESTMENALKAMGKIREQFVDYNDLRVCFPDEVEAILGARYQRGQDRSVRLLDALREIFERFQRLTLEPLRDMNKREAKEFLSSIESLPRFVVSRIMLLGLDAHAFPLDSKIVRALHKAQCLPSTRNPDSVAAVLERSVRANQTVETYTRLERWLIAFESGSC